MKFNKIALLDFEKDLLEKEYLDKLLEITEKLEIVEKNDENKLEKIKDADILLVRITTMVDKNIINNCSNLKYIGVMATSFSKIDTKYAAQKGIVVTNLAGYSTEAVAEFVFATLLEYIRELERGKTNARKGEFSFDSFLTWELKGKKFGIIGLGNIGKGVSEIALGFGLDVRYWSRNRKPEYEAKGVKYVEFDEVLNSDIIDIHLARNKETEGIFSKEKLDKIKEGSIVICLTSLKLFDFDYLIGLLKKGKFTLISDYLDLLPEDKRKELEGLPNLVAYPPIAFRTREAIKRQKDLLIDNLMKFAEGKIQNKVN
ncbi:MAG: 2-hydroxyacid dehydrogenase [Candidatus Aenigmatarchaeota archaeon]